MMDFSTLLAGVPAPLAMGSYQPFPFPAPLWLLQTLLVVGFFLHAIPMNVSLAGGATAALLMFFGKKNDNPHATRAGKTLAYSLPFFMTAAITNGIVPLLFLQVVYGPLIYTSSVLMAAPWFAVVGLLLLAYYGFYIYNYAKEGRGGKAPWVISLSSLLLLVVAFIFSNNMTLMLTPQKFLALYQHSTGGSNLNLGEPSLIPRYLHFVLASVAVTGLTLGCFGLYQKGRDEAYSQWLLKTGASVFLGITLLQGVVGTWFFLSLPSVIQALFLGGNKVATLVFAHAVGLDVVALTSAALTVSKGSATAFKWSLWSTGLLIFLMIVMRHLVRHHSTIGFLDPATHAVEPQWGLIATFVGLAVIMLSYFVWLGKVVWKGYHPQG
jgi:hypothetical protein